MRKKIAGILLLIMCVCCGCGKTQNRDVPKESISQEVVKEEEDIVCDDRDDDFDIPEIDEADFEDDDDEEEDDEDEDSDDDDEEEDEDSDDEEEEEDERIKVAIVGKPNVGKSSLINKLLGENRLIVSDIAGTTRDAVDTEVTYNGKESEKEYIYITKSLYI